METVGLRRGQTGGQDLGSPGEGAGGAERRLDPLMGSPG